MGYQAYRNLGGVPRDHPDFNPAVVYDPVPSNTVPYLLLVSVLGTFMLTQLRRLMICEWRLPFPSGTASGIMLTSFHTAVSHVQAPALAVRVVTKYSRSSMSHPIGINVGLRSSTSCAFLIHMVESWNVLLHAI
jgi:hypothetical protein